MTVRWVEDMQWRGRARPTRQHLNQLAGIEVVLHDRLEVLPHTKAREQHFLEAVAFVSRKSAVIDLDTLLALLKNQRLRLARPSKKYPALRWLFTRSSGETGKPRRAT